MAKADSEKPVISYHNPQRKPLLRQGRSHLLADKKTFQRIKIPSTGKVDTFGGNSIANGGTSLPVGGQKRAISGTIPTISGFTSS
jgi:hypothetical protein